MLAFTHAWMDRRIDGEEFHAQVNESRLESRKAIMIDDGA